MLAVSSSISTLQNQIDTVLVPAISGSMLLTHFVQAGIEAVDLHKTALSGHF